MIVGEIDSIAADLGMDSEKLNCDHNDLSVNDNCVVDKYERRCEILIKRLEDYRDENKRLLNHICQVKKLIYKSEKQKRYVNCYFPC